MKSAFSRACAATLVHFNLDGLWDTPSEAVVNRSRGSAKRGNRQTKREGLTQALSRCLTRAGCLLIAGG
jgi:hypothetical protein